MAPHPTHKIYKLHGTHKAVLLAVVHPVTCSTRSDDSLQLIGLHPNDLINAFIAPQLETLPTQLHGSEMITLQ
jgi:hypothetical protein